MSRTNGRHRHWYHLNRNTNPQPALDIDNFTVRFCLFEQAESWDAEIHQLNSDILLRHVLPKMNQLNQGVRFNYDETYQQGNIIGQAGQSIGCFYVS